MMPRLLFLLMLLLPALTFSQGEDKSIWFPQKNYTDHSRVSFSYIRSRSLPFNADLTAYAPLPQPCPDSLSDRGWLLAYYTRTIEKAYQEGLLDRAYLTDSIAMAQLANFTPPGSAFRLFTSGTRRYDKIKYLRYTISKGLPVLVGFAQKPREEQLRGQTTWDGQGAAGYYCMLIIGYDSPTASFQLIGPQGGDWGHQGYIWMTYRDLLAQAREVLCLENPTRSKRPENTARLGRPVELQLTARIQQLEQSGGKVTRLQQRSTRFAPRQQVYELDSPQPAQVDERYQLQLQIPKGRCTYLFVAQPDGSTTPAWMLEYNPQDTLVTLPPVSYYQFPDAGTHHFFILSSYQAIPRWRRYVDRYEFDERSVDPISKLYQAFGDYLLPFGKIQHTTDQITVSASLTQAKKEFVLPLIIQWQVKEE